MAQEINQILKRSGSYQGLRERASQENSSDNVNRGTIPADHPVWDVWNSIRSTYPGGTTNWEDMPPVEWAYALEGLSQEQIAKGLKRMVHEGSKFPPSAPEFRQLCDPDSWERQAHKLFDGKLLENKAHLHPDNIKAGKAALSQMKGLFK